MYTLYVLVLVFICRCGAEIRGLETQSVYYGLALTASRDTHNASVCVQQLSDIEEGIRNKKKWALKLLDASGAPKTGMYWGNNYWLGSRKQCMYSMVSTDPMLDRNLLPFTHESNDTVPPFTIGYYAAYFYHNSTFQIFVHSDNETKITLGLCLPSSCTEKEVFDYLQEYFDSRVLLQLQLFNMTLTMDGVHTMRGKFSWTHHPLSIIFVVSTIVIALLIVVGTAYDLWIHKRSRKIELIFPNKNLTNIVIAPKTDRKINEEIGDCNELNDFDVKAHNNVASIQDGQLSIKVPEERNIPEKLLLSFSWYTNAKEIMSMKVRPGTLMPFTGLRVILTTLVVFAHAFLFVIHQYDNKVSVFVYEASIFKQVMNNHCGVDLFILAGGFMMVYSLLKTKNLSDQEQQTHWSLLKEYVRGVIKRFRRLTPVYIYIITLVFTNTSYTKANSPFWANEENDIQCPKYWWTNLLYINNIYPGTYDTMCMSWTYYSSSDMQFFVVCSLLLFLSRRYFKTAVTILMGLFIASTVLIGINTYQYNYKPYKNNLYATAPQFYYPPWIRIGPYLVGCIMAFIYKKIDGKLTMNKVYIYVLWILSLAILGLLLFGFYDSNFSIYFSIVHTALGRTLFSACFGWIIFACLTGYGGILNTMLSAKSGLPLFRLSYIAYLMNPVVIYTVIMSFDAPWHLEDMNVFLAGNGLVFVTFVVSFILYISVELPLDKVINILTTRTPTK